MAFFIAKSKFSDLLVQKDRKFRKGVQGSMLLKVPISNLPRVYYLVLRYCCSFFKMVVNAEMNTNGVSIVRSEERRRSSEYWLLENGKAMLVIC